MEEWKTIPRATDYEVSDQGRVKRRIDGNHNSSKKKGYVLKESYNGKGYKRVTLPNNNKWQKKAVHRLVLEAFICPCPEGKETNHIDGVKTNNHLSNLEWVTASENVKHSFKIGLNKTKKGENVGTAKLKDGEVWLIKKLLASDMCKEGRLFQSEIAKMFNVTPTAILLIKKGINWSHIKYEEGEQS